MSFRKRILRVSALLVALVSGRGARAADALPDASKLPPAAAGKVDYARDIAPIFENSCFRCHGPNRPKSHFRLDTRESALKGGDDGGDIVPGESARSRLSFYVARLVADKEMPPDGKGEALTAAQVGLLRAWIDQGAAYAGTNGASRLEFEVQPTLRYISVSGNAAKFRQMFGEKEGWGGGIQSFNLTEKQQDGSSFHVEGQALWPDQDYKLRLRLEKPEVGFIDGGFEQYRTYDNDTGGYAAVLNPSSYSLNRDFHLDDGKAWINFGLNRPDLPKLTLGYEYDYRTGTESLLEWGPVTGPGGSKNIYPSWQTINERTHVIKFDFEDEIYSVKVEDSFRAEFYRMNDQSTDSGYFLQGQSGPESYILTTQTEDHFQAGNAFRLGKDVYDGWYLSAGYLYTRLGGDAAVLQNAALTPLAPSPPGFALNAGYPLFSTPDIVLDAQSHTANLNSFLGPWRGLSLATGVEAQWLRQSSFGPEQEVFNLVPVPATNATPVFGTIDQALAVEHAVLKYDGLPFTVVSAEGRLQQESLRYLQGESELGSVDSDADIDIKEVRAGLSSSPWRTVSFGFDLMRRETANHYNLPGYGNPGNNLLLGAYPGYILAHDFTTDEAAAKLVLRPVRWLKATLSYQVDSTDYEMQGADLTLLAGPGAGSTSSFQTAVYNSHVYNASVLATPWQRATLSGSFSYFDTRIHSADSGLAALTAYSGGTCVAQGQATFTVNECNTLRAGYSFSQSDFGQNNSPAGLPLGLDYTLHGVKAGWVHKMKGDKSLALEYGFYRYREPTAGTANDFNAHSVFLTYTMRWR